MYSNLARCHYKLANYQKCIEYCASSLSLDKYNFKANLLFGDSLVEMSEIEHMSSYCMDSLDYFNKALKTWQETGQEVYIVEINKKIVAAKHKYEQLRKLDEYYRIYRFQHKINEIMNKRKREVELK